MKISASTKLRNGIFGPLFLTAAIALVALTPVRIQAQQLPEVNILTAVGNMAFSAVWVAEQLKYFEEEGVRAENNTGGRRRAVSERRRWPFGALFRTAYSRLVSSHLRKNSK